MQGAPTSARPTTWMDANSPKVVHGVGGCCAERRGRRSLPGVCEFAEGGIKPFPCAAGAVEDAGPYSCAATNARHPFLPPAGEGGIRRSPARRMTEEGERDRLLTVQSFAYSHSCGHFHSAVPSRSPSPAALVGDTLPRWGREWVSAPSTNSMVRRIRNASM